MKKKYTVVLRYPDYISDDQELYLLQVKAKTPFLAALKAQRLAMSVQCDVYKDNDPTDFKVEYVFKGDCIPVMNGYAFEYAYAEAHIGA